MALPPSAHVIANRSDCITCLREGMLIYSRLVNAPIGSVGDLTLVITHLPWHSFHLRVVLEQCHTYRSVTHRAGVFCSEVELE
jgi:hypothetical protein